MKTLHMKSLISHLSFLLLLLSLTGCNTIDSVNPGKGVSFRVSGKSYDQVWKASVAVMSRQLTLVEDSKAHGVIRAEARAGMTTWGEVVGVFITPAGPSATGHNVEVVSLKRSAMQITGQDWTRTVITGIKAELGE